MNLKMTNRDPNYRHIGYRPPVAFIFCFDAVSPGALGDQIVRNFKNLTFIEIFYGQRWSLA